MRIAVPRFDPTVGDIVGNGRLIVEAAESAVAAGAHMLLLPELALSGYPPRDLLLRGDFVAACEAEIDRLMLQLPSELLVLAGTPTRGAGGVLHNSVVALRDGNRVGICHKRLMPDYDVFDEDRWFTPGGTSTIVDHRGQRIGLLVCEDLWQGDDAEVSTYWPCDPVADLAVAGCDAVLAASASPFVAGKSVRQVQRVRDVARQLGVDVVSVNQAGANDDLVFGGDVIHAGPDGELRKGRLSFCARDPELVVQLGAAPMEPEPTWGDDFDRAFALREAIRGYASKTGSAGVLIGLSGGIDSALTATLAVAAVGSERVRGVSMPSRYSADASLRDAQLLCESLGMAPPDVVEIEPVHHAIRDTLQSAGRSVVDGDLVDQNLQARIRGQILMAMSNELGWLVLPTGNKSELAVGYATLYGDMCGALAVLGDVRKTQVQAMAVAINGAPERLGLSRPPIPIGTIDRPPTAELAPDQCDQDSLPAYEVLDAIIEHIVDHDRSVAETVAATGLEAEFVASWARRIDRNAFKRWQAAIIPKVSRRAFGRGRRWPLVARMP
ncbi:MAG: NAD+ synthase [Phycisphaerales bacterium]|nr:NAD+ synthase [Phycisphaerales bacterium]